MESMNGYTKGGNKVYHRILSTRNFGLGIACFGQIAFGIGVEWGIYGVVAWLEIGPLCIWFGWRGRKVGC